MHILMQSPPASASTVWHSPSRAPIQRRGVENEQSREELARASVFASLLAQERDNAELLRGRGDMELG